MRQYHGHLDGIRLPQTGVALSRAGLIAGGHRGADWGLFERVDGGAKAGAAQGRDVLLAGSAADLGQRVGVVLPGQPFRSDPRGLEAQARPLPLVIPPLDRLRVPWLDLYGASPEKITDLDREDK